MTLNVGRDNWLFKRSRLTTRSLKTSRSSTLSRPNQRKSWTFKNRERCISSKRMTWHLHVLETTKIDCLLRSIKLSSSETMRSYLQSKERLKIDSVSLKNEPCSKMRGKGTKSTRMTRLRTGLTCASNRRWMSWKGSASKKCN